MLNYTQLFASDPDYIMYSLVVSQQDKLTGRISVALEKVYANNLTAGMILKDFSDMIIAFKVSVNAYISSWLQSKVLLHNRKVPFVSFSRGVAVGTARIFYDFELCRFLIFPVIAELVGQIFSNEHIDYIDFEWCACLKFNHVLLVRHFQYSAEVFFKGHLVKWNMPFQLSFTCAVNSISTRYCRL